MANNQYPKIVQNLETLVCDFYADFNKQINLLKSISVSASNGDIGDGIGGDPGLLLDIGMPLSHTNEKMIIDDSAISSSVLPIFNVNSFKSVPYGHSVRVTLAFIYSSRNFYLHLDYDEVECFWQTLNDHYGGLELASVKLNTIEVNNFYCADIDGEFQRVKVVADSQNGSFDLLLVDFGEIKSNIKKDVIYQLLPNFASKPAFALNCFIDELWIDDLSAFEPTFLDMVAHPENYCTEMRATFSEPLENQKFPVKLEFKLNDNSVKTVANFPKFSPKYLTCFKSFDFKEFMTNSAEQFNGLEVEAFKKFNAIYPSTYLDFNTKYNCQVSSVADISNFVCIVDSFNDKDGEFINFCTNINHFYKDWPLLQDFKKSANSLVVFRLNNQYFRGFVYSDDSSQYGILSIDCGFSASIPSGDIFPLATSVSIEKTPPFALLCEVDDLIPIKDGTWSNFAIKAMKNFLRNEFTISPRSFTDKYSVEVSTPTQNIGSVLKKLNFARPKK